MSEMKIAIVGGCGHVGLPLGMVLAEFGHEITLFDINEAAVKKVNAGILPHLEEGAEQLLPALLAKKKLRASTDKKSLEGRQVLIFTVWNDLGHWHSLLGELMPYIDDQQTLIFRSTLAPHSSAAIWNDLKMRGKKTSLAYCPERLIQGKGLSEIKELPQIISAFDNRGLEVAAQIFSQLSKHPPVVLEPLEAELAKLFCNSWRYINFAISNQFFQMAEKAGVDFHKIQRALTQDYPRLNGFAGAGFSAGPCLYKDTVQLAAFSQNPGFLGHQALLINESMPQVAVQKLKKRLGASLKGKRVGILGMTFKADNDDVRKSLSFKLKKILEREGAQVFCHDPFLRPADFPQLTFNSLEDIFTLDGAIIGAPHSLYKNLANAGPFILIDVWGVCSP